MSTIIEKKTNLFCFFIKKNYEVTIITFCSKVHTTYIRHMTNGDYYDKL